MPMGKTSTLIYLFSNFEESELINESLYNDDLKEFENIFNFLEENTKKVPDRMVDQLIDFAKNYS